MPPTVQNAPLEGSTGNCSPTARAAASIASRMAPGPHRIVRRALSGASKWSSRLRSTTTPSPMAPPDMLLPDPRGMSGVAVSDAQRTSSAASSGSTGTATARGMMRAIPAASLKTARAGRSSRNVPRNPADAGVSGMQPTLGYLFDVSRSLTAVTGSPMEPRIAERDSRVLEAERFAREILPPVSRTFALSIRVLPGTLGQAVRTAYLLCRIADTIEDAPRMSAADKAALLEDLLRCFDDTEAAETFPRRLGVLAGDETHVRLALHAHLVFVSYRDLP